MRRVAVSLAWATAHSCGADLGRVGDVVRHRVAAAHPDADLTVSVSPHARTDVVTCADDSVRRDVEAIVRAAWSAVPWTGSCSA